MFSLKVKF